MIILKASTIGLIGGAAGMLVGIVAAYTVGGRYLDLSVGISPLAAMLGPAVAIAVAVIASYLPARKAARLDPCACLQEL